MAVRTPSQFIALARVLYPTNSRGEISAAVLRAGQLQTFIELGVTAVTSFGVNDPPASPASTDAYIIGDAPTGVWVGSANKLVYRDNGAWVYYPTSGAIGPMQDGLEVYALDTDLQYTWTGTGWLAGGGGGTVNSVFGRMGTVVAVAGDYTSTLVTNSSAVVGANVTAALNQLNSVFTDIAKGLVPASGGGTANFLRADGTFAAPPGGSVPDANYGDITVTGSGAVWTINASVVTFAKMQDISDVRLLGNASGSSAPPEQIAVTGGIIFDTTNLTISAFTGDVTKAQGGTVLTLATVNAGVGAFGSATQTVTYTVNAKGLITASVQQSIAIPASQVTDFNNAAEDAVGGILLDTSTIDFTYTSHTSIAASVINGSITNTKLANVSTATFKGRTTAGTGVPEDLTVTQATALLDVFSTSLQGVVPASGGGSVNFLRADGSWAVPPGTGGIADGDYGDITVSSSGTVWTIDAAVVTFSKIQNIATDSLIGRDTAGTGVPENITLNATLSMTGAGALQRAALTGDIAASAGSNSTTLATVNSNIGTFGSATAVSQVTVNAKGLTTAAVDVSIAIPSTQVTDFTEAAQDAVGLMVGVSLVYVDATPLLARAALTGDITASQNSNATTLATVNSNVGSFGDATHVGAFTVNGKGLVTAASSVAITGLISDGDKGDITVSSSGTVWTIDNDVVTFPKMQNIVTDSLVGRDTAGTGDPENIGLNATLSMDGSGNLQRAALAGDIIASAGSNTTAIGVNKVLDTMLRQGAAKSVIGVTGNSTANVADIAGTTDQVLRVNSAGTALAFGTVATGGIADAAVTSAKLRDSSANSVIGRAANSTGVPADIAASAADQVFRMNGAGTALGFGAIDISKSAAITGVLLAAGFPALTGDVTTVAGALASTIANDAVTNAKLANMATQTVKGRNTAGTGDPEDLSMTTLSTMLNLTGLYMPLAGGVFSGAVGFPDGSLGTPSIYRASQVANGIYFIAGGIHLSPNATTDFLFDGGGIAQTPRTGAQVLSLESTNNGANAFFTAGANDAVFRAFNVFQKNRAGAKVQLSDSIGGIEARGYDGAAYQIVGRLNWSITETGTVSATVMGSEFQMRTNAIGGINNAITFSGNQDTGLSYLSNVFLTQNRHILLRSYTTGSLPSASPAGQLVYNSTTGQPTASNGSAWSTASSIASSVMYTAATRFAMP